MKFHQLFRSKEYDKALNKPSIPNTKGKTSVPKKTKKSSLKAEEGEIPSDAFLRKPQVQSHRIMKRESKRKVYESEKHREYRNSYRRHLKSRRSRSVELRRKKRSDSRSRIRKRKDKELWARTRDRSRDREKLYRRKDDRGFKDEKYNKEMTFSPGKDNSKVYKSNRRNKTSSYRGSRRSSSRERNRRSSTKEYSNSYSRSSKVNKLREVNEKIRKRRKDIKKGY